MFELVSCGRWNRSSASSAYRSDYVPPSTMRRNSTMYGVECPNRPRLEHIFRQIFRLGKADVLSLSANVLSLVDSLFSG